MLEVIHHSQIFLDRDLFAWDDNDPLPDLGRVLITGAGGNVGRGLARYLVQRGCVCFGLVDHDDSRMFESAEDLRRRGANVQVFLGDVNDASWLTKLTRKFAPDWVVHAAVLKGVPVLEADAYSAYLTNSLSVANAAYAAHAGGATHFVLPSSNEAYSCDAVFGLSKRLGEHYATRAAQLYPNLHVSILRFGAVLMSYGSVGESFYLRALEGRPITVLRPDLRRYFFTLEEISAGLCALVSSNNVSGAIYQMELSDSTLLLDLARDIVRKTASTSTIEIGEGLRPGEFAVPPGIADMTGLSLSDIPHLYRETRPWPTLGDHADRALLAARSADHDGVARAFHDMREEFNPAPTDG